MLSYLFNPQEEAEALREENPARTRRRRKGRKAKRRYGSLGRHRRRARRTNKGRHHRRLRRRNGLFRSRGTGRYKRSGPGRRLRFRGRGRGWNPKRSHRRLRRGHRRYGHRRPRRRSNPGRSISSRSGMGGLMMRIPEIIPIHIPLPGLLGTVGNSMIQALGAGGAFFIGYFGSGALANYVASSKQIATWAAADPKDWRIKWARPLFFAASAGAIGGAGVMIGKALKLKNAGFLGLLMAAGAGLRALGGVVAAVTDVPSQPGLMADVRNAAVGLAGGAGDFLQEGTSDFLQEGTSDFLQEGTSGVADYEEAGSDQGSLDVPEMVNAGEEGDGFSGSDEMEW